MSAHSSSKVALTFSVDRTAPKVIGSSLRIRWTADDGRQSGLLDLTTNISVESVFFSSGLLGPSTVSGSASVAMNSDGFFYFSGHIHESGLLGHNYAFGMTIDALDAVSGKALVFTNAGNVHGTIDPGSRDDDWAGQSFSQVIVDNWEKIRVNQGSHSTLHVSTDPFAVFDLVVAPLVVAVAAAGAILFISDPNTTCYPPTISSDEKGGVAVDLICTQEFPKDGGQ